MSSFEPLVRNITNHRERRNAINDGSSFQRLWLVCIVLNGLECTRISAFRSRSTSA